MSKKVTHEDYVEKLKLIRPDLKVLGIYSNAKTAILHKCECGGEWFINPNNALHGKHCSLCANKKKGQTYKKTHAEFCEDVFNLVHNEYVVLGEYQTTHVKIKLRHCSDNCNNHEFEVQPANFLQGTRCPKCYGNQLFSHEEVVKKIEILGNGEYEVIGTYKNSSTKFAIKHILCGYIYEVKTQNFINSGTRCPVCTKSKNEGKIIKWLDAQKVKYKPQYIFNDCKNINPLPFDFAIFNENNDLQCLIEYDGEFHYISFKGEEYFQYQQKLDKIKTDYCLNNNIRLIRIPYWEQDNLNQILTNTILNK